MNCFHERILELERGSGKACPWERWRSGGRNLNMVFFPSNQQHIRVRNYYCIAGYTLTLDLGARGEDSNIFSTSSFPGEERSHAKEPLVQKYLLVVRKNLTSFDSYEIIHVPRKQNTRADVLSKLGSTCSIGIKDFHSINLRLVWIQHSERKGQIWFESNSEREYWTEIWLFLIKIWIMITLYCNHWYTTKNHRITLRLQSYNFFDTCI